MLRVVSWNLNWWAEGARAAAPEDVIEGLDGDIVALQEAKGQAIPRAHRGPSVFSHMLHPGATWAWMGCGLLFRGDSEILAQGVIDTLPKPQRSVWARVRLAHGQEVTAVSWHAPNRAGDGLAIKMAAFGAMSDWLRAAPRPVVLGGDLNTWRDPVDLKPAEHGEPHFGEHEFVGPQPRHGLHDAFREVLDRSGTLDACRNASAQGPLAVSHVLPGGASHRMDRIFISDDFTAVAGGYDLRLAQSAGSDHAVHVIDVVT